MENIIYDARDIQQNTIIFIFICHAACGTVGAPSLSIPEEDVARERNPGGRERVAYHQGNSRGCENHDNKFSSAIDLLASRSMLEAAI